MKKHFVSASLFLILLFICGCGDSRKQITQLEDAKNAKIGVMTGTTGEQLTIKRYPQASVKSFDDVMDAIAALKSDQIDAVVTGFPTAMNVCKKNKDLTYLKDALDYENTAIALRKGNEKLLSELNGFIAELHNDGTLKDMRRRWFKTDTSPYETVDIKAPEKGEVLKIGVAATREPFCFLNANKKVTGHDGELAYRVSAKLKRPVEFVDMKFGALITALQSGKIDLIITGMTATPERKKSVDFTESYFENSQVMLVKKPVEEKTGSGNKTVQLKTHDDLKDKKIGVLLGSVHDTYVAQRFPKAAALQYKNPSELVLAVKSGKVDAALYTHETLLEILRNDNSLTLLGDTLFSVPIAMGFNKQSDELREKFNSFLKAIKSNGLYNDMVDRWMIKGNTAMPEIKNSGQNGTIVVGMVSDKGLPFTVVKDNKLIGFDIELSQRFAAFLGKTIKFSDMEFGSLIIAAATKKIDMIASTLMITEERKKQVDFSDPYMHLGASVFALKNNVSPPEELKLRTVNDLADKKIGVYEGTLHDVFVTKKFPDAPIKRFNSTTDILLALRAGKIDAALYDYYAAKVMLYSSPDIGLLAENVLDLPLGIGFSKENPQLKNEFNEFLDKAKSDGSLKTIQDRWLVNEPDKVIMPEFNFDRKGKKLTLAVAIGDLPYSAMVNGEFAGFDIELVKTFALKKGYDLRIVSMDISALVPALAAGKVDMMADCIAITEERAKTIDFSNGYLNLKTSVVTLKKSLAANNETVKKESEPSFLDDIITSFNNNIIVEKRYLLILEGLQTTIEISILAILFGTLLGSLICYMRMSKKKSLQIPAKVYISLLRGTPVLVVLMIIFYVVFASIDVDPVIVAVIAFGMNFGAYVSEMFRTGIEGVDKGQNEAGIAIGFTKIETFIHIIAPQAARRILPVYKGEVISLVKMTSIVGYIAVQDLTKASDIIRSRTFDAFFPLIMVAFMYFFISWLLMLLLGYLERKFDPKFRIKRG